MYKCKKCGSTDIHVAMWVNPNTLEIPTDEPLFDFNEAPTNVCVQWCDICDDECEVVDKRKRKKKRLHKSTVKWCVKQIRKWATSASLGATRDTSITNTTTLASKKECLDRAFVLDRLADSITEKAKKRRHK